VDGASLHLDGMVADPDGHQLLRTARTGRTSDAESIGSELARELIGRGAEAILAAVERMAIAPELMGRPMDGPAAGPGSEGMA
jgi:hydroxymethylbilane synthase